MPDFAHDVQEFFSASEHLLCRTPLARLSDDEGILVNYYINELTARYGALNEDTDRDLPAALLVSSCLNRIDAPESVPEGTTART